MIGYIVFGVVAAGAVGLLTYWTFASGRASFSRWSALVAGACALSRRGLAAVSAKQVGLIPKCAECEALWHAGR